MLPPLDDSCRDPSALVCRLASSSEVVVPRTNFFFVKRLYNIVDSQHKKKFFFTLWPSKRESPKLSETSGHYSFNENTQHFGKRTFSPKVSSSQLSVFYEHTMLVQGCWYVLRPTRKQTS